MRGSPLLIARFSRNPRYLRQCCRLRAYGRSPRRWRGRWHCSPPRWHFSQKTLCGAAIMATKLPEAPRVGMVSLGCPKNLVDSERILTKLRSDGYAMSPDYAGADVVLVNTCGFLDSAKEESLEAIGEAMAENGRVIVTGCMGPEADTIRARFPNILAVTGAHQYEQVVDAVREHSPMPPNAFLNLVPEAGLKLTPRHYSYLKISE